MMNTPTTTEITIANIPILIFKRRGRVPTPIHNKMNDGFSRSSLLLAGYSLLYFKRLLSLSTIA